MSSIQVPGLVDAHVHLRNPGGEHKETVATGTAAALAGGFTAILGMPNTTPPTTDGRLLADARTAHDAEAFCDVGLFLGATDDNALDAAQAAHLACGLKIYVNDTFGTLRIERLPSLAAHFVAWPKARPIVLHAEDLSVAAGIGLSAAYDRRVHIAHVSRAEEIRLIAAAKEAGLSVTCEVAPHHLLMTEEDMSTLGPYGEVRPRLARASDREALWDHIDVIDCIATDHAPHTRQEKESESPPPGMPGLETALPLMLTAVHEGRLSLDRLVEMMSRRPAEIFGISTPGVSEVELEMGSEWTLPESGYQTRCDWSPFAGWKVRGRVLRVTLRGTTAWEDGELKVGPGFGQMSPQS